MPSLHIGWAVLIAVVVCRTGPRALVVLACLHALTTVAVVTVTANHWLLDGLVAVALLGVALLVVPRPSRHRQPGRTAAGGAGAVNPGGAGHDRAAAAGVPRSVSAYRR
jgi:hypothetical protein